MTRLAIETPTLGLRVFGDELLAAIAPVGLALAAGVAVVLDLSGEGPAYPTERTMADLVDDGPRRSELRPDRSGVAVLGNGGVSWEAGVELARLLGETWPAVVVRVGSAPVPFPVIPVRPLWPGFLAPAGDRPAVWQRVPGGSAPPGSGPVLPPPGRRTVAALLTGRRPVRSRWVRAWETVWGLPWR